jgi:hypothetical protein
MQELFAVQSCSNVRINFSGYIIWDAGKSLSKYLSKFISRKVLLTEPIHVPELSAIIVHS